MLAIMLASHPGSKEVIPEQHVVLVETMHSRSNLFNWR